MLSLGNKLTLNSAKPIYHFVNKYSIDFDGVDDRIITDGADTVAQPTTYSFWCKSSTTGQNKGVFGHGADKQGGFHFNASSGMPLLYLNSSCFRYWVANDEQDDGEWHHWVVYSDTNDITNSKLYVDGVLQTVNSTVLTTSPLAYTESLTIGSDQQVGGNSFEGKIDEFAVFDRELTQDEITRMYNTYYSPNRVANGNFSQIGNEEVTNGDFSQIGSEQVTNGDFSTDSDWTKDAGWTIANGKASNDGVADGYLRQDTTLVNAKIYKVVFTVSNYTSGSVRVRFMGGTSVNGDFVSSNGTYTQYITSTGNTNFRLQADNYNGSIDNVSVKEVGQDWTFLSGWSMGDNKAIASPATDYLYQDNVYDHTAVKTYKLTYDIEVDSGTFKFLILGKTGSSFFGEETTSGTYTIYFTTTGSSGDGRLYIAHQGNFDGSVNSVSVKEVGQHWIFGTGWSTDGTKAIVSSGGDGANLAQDKCVPNVTNKIMFTVSDYTGTGFVRVRTGGSSQYQDVNANGTYTINVIPTATTFSFARYITGSLSIDNVVVQELKHDATNLMLNAGAYQSANPLITSTKSMEFDGSDDYLSVSDSDDLDIGTNDFSVSAWIKTTDADGTVLAKRNGSVSGGAGYEMGLSNGKISYYFKDAAGNAAYDTEDTSTVNDGKWHHIAWVFDRSGLGYRYIDGVNSGTNDSLTGAAGSLANTDVALGMGARIQASADNFLGGKITETGIWNRALTSLEVASLYNQGMPTNLLVNRNNYQSGNPTVFNTKQVDFDGTDDYAVAGLGSPVVTGDNPITLSAWVKSDGVSSGYEGAVSVGENDGFLSHWLGIFNGSHWGGGLNGGNLNSGVAIVENTWTHLVYTYAGGSNGDMKIYVNGVEKVTGTGTANIPTSSPSGNYIGNIEDNYYFEGDISQVGIWNEAITADEVSSLYNHGLPIDLTTNQAAYESSSNLVGYWRMGSGTLDTYPLIADQTNATLGSEQVTNGDFATNSDWTLQSSWTISGGKANYDAVNTQHYLKQTMSSIAAGKTVKIQFDISDVQEGKNAFFKLEISGTPETVFTYTTFTEGTYTYYHTITSGLDRLNFVPLNTSTGGSFSIDNVSVKQVQGNPAIMTNQTSSDIENGSPYANIVQNGDFNGSSFGWTENGTWTYGNNNEVCTGNGTNQILTQSGILTSGKFYTYSIDIISSTLSSQEIRVYVGGTDYITHILSGSAETISGNTVSAGANLQIRVNSSNTSGVLTIDNVSVAETNTGLQGYWKMGDGTNDEYPYIFDQTSPDLGSELVTNGDFSNGTTDWSSPDYNSTLSVVDGQMKIVNTISLGRVRQAITTVVGETYLVRATVTNIDSSTGIQLKLSNASNLDGAFFNSAFNTTTNPVTITHAFVATATTTYIGSSQGSSVGQSGLLDNVSVKLVNGNLATMTNMVEGNITNQYPLTKIRNYYRMGDGILDGYPIIQDQTSPNLAHIPTTNLLTYSENFSQSMYAKTNATVTGGFASPIGDTNAYKLTTSAANAQILFTLSSQPISNKSVSIFAKANTSTSKFKIIEQYYYGHQTTFDLNLGVIESSNGFSSKMENVGNGWYRCTHVQSGYSSGQTNATFAFRTNTADSLFIFGSQYEIQSQATPYIKSDGIAAVRKATTTNLITYSEDFNNAIWSKVAAGTGIVPIVTSDYSLSPIGTQTADRIQFNLDGGTSSSDTSYITTGLSLGTINASLSIYLKTNDSTTKDITLRLGASLFDYNVTVTSEWKRFSLSGNTNVDRVQLLLYGNQNSQTADLSVWGVQVEQQTQAETYAPTFGLPVTIDLFTENNYGTMTNMSANDIVEDTP